MSRRSRLLPVAIAVLGALWAAPAFALEFEPCTATPDYDCATLRVPLDPAAPGGESLALEVRRLSETRDGEGVLIALAGGPGQGATEFVDDFAGVLADGLVDRQLIVFDQRGTGRSGALSCPALETGAERLSPRALAARVGRCARELGPRRRHYTTAEVVEDLDALRASLGAERISIFGVSYGAYVAQRYARRFPARIDRLVLDSPVAQDQGGMFDVASYRAVRRVLRTLCRGGRCLGVRDPVGDLRRLRARLPISGTVFDARGMPRRVRLAREAELFDLLVSSDFSPALRGAFPAAVRAAAHGDAAPLLRLVALERGESEPREPDERNVVEEEFSNALFFATTCEEKPVPWRPEAAPSERVAQRDAALDELGATAFRPFGRGAAASTQVGTGFCLEWPAPLAAPAPAPGRIDAQALVLSGAADLRTPTGEAERTVAAIRDGTLVRVPHAGHAVVSQALPCVERALSRFFLGTAVGNPCDGRRPSRATAPAPVAPRRRAGGRGIAPAALGTVKDAMRTAAIPGELASPYRLGGLRGGSACVVPGPSDAAGRRPLRVTLRRASYVRGVAASGSATVAGGRLRSLRLALRGAGDRRGRLVLDGRTLRGRFAGRRLRLRLGSRSARMPLVRVAAEPERAAGC